MGALHSELSFLIFANSKVTFALFIFRHWSCYTTWPQEGRGGAAMSRLRRQMLAANSFRERLYDNPVGHIWMTEDGEEHMSPKQTRWPAQLCINSREVLQQCDNPCKPALSIAVNKQLASICHLADA